ncbi:ATP-binding protein [bacterium]|nr:ATP-binding protein [candidate division CSSED10-310 bacterium]
MTQPVKEITLTLPMQPAMELAASKIASSIARLIKLDQNKIDEIKIALIEATLNAFEHSKSEDRTVQIKFLTSSEALTIIIKDHGSGFDPDKVGEPDIREKLHDRHKRGWGLKLMTGLMDKVTVHSDETGTTVVMVKQLNGEQGGSDA